MTTSLHQLNAVPLADLRGGIAVVTGAASGIGLGMLLRCAQEGMVPVCLDVNEGQMREAEDVLREGAAAAAVSAGVEAAEVLCLRCDAGNYEEVFTVANYIRQRFPGRPVSFLSANAGFGTPAVLDGRREAIQRGADVHMFGVIWLMQAFKSSLLAQAPAPCAIVNTSSIAGIMPGGGSYGVFKHASRAITEATYQEFAALGAVHVKVHCLHPGIISTNISARRPDGSLADFSESSGRQRSVFQEAIEDYGTAPAMLVCLASLFTYYHILGNWMQVYHGRWFHCNCCMVLTMQAQRVCEAIEDGRFYIVVPTCRRQRS